MRVRTLYLLGTTVGAASCASLIASLVDDVTETVTWLAARWPNGGWAGSLHSRADAADVRAVLHIERALWAIAAAR